LKQVLIAAYSDLPKRASRIWGVRIRFASVPELPDQFRIKIELNDHPVAGVWLGVALPVRRKNEFNSVHGPTDEDGVVTVSRTSIESWASLSRNLFLMDYEADWTGEILATPSHGARRHRTSLGGSRPVGR